MYFEVLMYTSVHTGVLNIITSAVNSNFMINSYRGNWLIWISSERMRKIIQRKCNDKNISYKNSYTSFDDKVKKVNAFDHREQYFYPTYDQS